MLQLGTGMQTIQGITVFPDHADPEQYWYLPAHISIARRPEDDWPQFTFMKFKRKDTSQGVEGGGYLMFTVALKLSEDVEREVRSKIPANARLSVVPFDSGTVECVALNLQGPGGTTAVVDAAGSFTAVQQILGARVPSLFGDNNAVFSLSLSEEGATLVEAAFAAGAAPIGVIYQLNFTAMQPALDVKITADFERIYEHFSAGLNANVYYVELGIQVGIEELVQNGAITIEVTNFSTSDDQAAQEKMAIDFFTQHLLQSWFTPTLTPGTLQGGMATAPHAGGGAGLFGPGSGSGSGTGTGSGSGSSGSGGSGSGRGSGSGGGQQPPPPPPATGGGAGTTGGTRGTGGTGTTGGTRGTGGSGGTGSTGSSGGTTGGTGTTGTGTTGTGTTGTGTTGGGTTPPPVTGTRAFVVQFLEEGSSEPVHGRFTVSHEEGGASRDTSTDGTPTPLRITVPATWTGQGLAVTATSFPELTMADADQLRAHVVSGAAVVASGQREAPLGMAIASMTATPGTSDLSATVRIPITKTVVTASSADALVMAVFPGGQLVQPGVYDCRRVAGTNDFELITPGWPGSFE